MDVIKEKVEELRTVIEESAEYQNFLAARRQVEQIPGLAEKIREFCWRNYELQNIDGEDLYELSQRSCRGGLFGAGASHVPDDAGNSCQTY